VAPHEHHAVGIDLGRSGKNESVKSEEQKDAAQAGMPEPASLYSFTFHLLRNNDE
jgi:hypothetical protein